MSWFNKPFYLPFQKKGPSFVQKRTLYTYWCFLLGLEKIDPVVLEMILKFVSVFSLCRFYLPFERTLPLILYLSKDVCAKFCWNRPNGSWEKDRNGKSLLWQRRQWKQRQKFSIRKAHLSLLLRWAKIHTISFNSKSILKSTIMP